ncbi:hypothetical protein AX15_001430 [Amanita polypyramis BW_CC]|nr:hypothetical protein AX15_001430 [Amanita polypyramis BW_CC]
MAHPPRTQTHGEVGSGGLFAIFRRGRRPSTKLRTSSTGSGSCMLGRERVSPVIRYSHSQEDLMVHYTPLTRDKSESNISQCKKARLLEKLRGKIKVVREKSRRPGQK